MAQYCSLSSTLTEQRKQCKKTSSIPTTWVVDKTYWESHVSQVEENCPFPSFLRLHSDLHWVEVQDDPERTQNPPGQTKQMALPEMDWCLVMTCLNMLPTLARYQWDKIWRIVSDDEEAGSTSSWTLKSVDHKILDVGKLCQVYMSHEYRCGN